jgi:hypothetical protein
MLREAPDLGFPETKPPIESFRGRLVPKVSPRRRHGVLQLEIGAILAGLGSRARRRCDRMAVLSSSA